MWHVTYDMWWGVNILSKFQLPSFYGLRGTVFKDISTKDHFLKYWINHSISSGGLWRTAQARAPEKWKGWERVPSQFEILGATFGYPDKIASEISVHQLRWANGNGGCEPNWFEKCIRTTVIGKISLTIQLYIFYVSGDCTWQPFLVGSQPILDFMEPWPRHTGSVKKWHH